MKNTTLLLLLVNIFCFSQRKEQRQALLDAKKNGIEYIYKNQNSTYNGHYALVMATSKFLSKKVTISVDYGERSTFFENDTERDENGKPIVFNTVVDALNYMKKNRCSFLDAYAITVGNQNVYHYLFEKNS
jgi:hypothetical protein